MAMHEKEIKMVVFKSAFPSNPFFCEESLMCKCQMLFVTVVGLVVLSGGYAAADTIIDPITPTTTSGFSSQLVRHEHALL